VLHDSAGISYILPYTTAIIAARTGDGAALPAALPDAKTARNVLSEGGRAHWAGSAEQVIAIIERIQAELDS